MKLPFVGRHPEATSVDQTPAGKDLARVASWLLPEAFLLESDASDVEQALRIAAESIAFRHAMSSTYVFEGLRRREQSASTAIGAGFAIPHARLHGIDRPGTVFVRLRKAIPFAATDGLPVHSLLVIMLPAHGSGIDHLRMLALISTLLSMRGFRKRVEAVPNADAADDIFRREIAKLVRTNEAKWVFA